MGGLFKKKFDAQKDMTIVAMRDGKVVVDATALPPGTRMHLRTDGLSKRKLPELELVDIPLELVRSAAGLLNLVAAYCANERPIKQGESWGMTMGGCLVAARGFLVKSNDGEFLRLVDVDSKEDGAPRLAVSTIAFLRGMGLVEEDRDAALVNWLAGVSYFPGAPSRVPARAQQGALVNEQNFLTWLALARHDEEQHQAAHYRSALMRSADLWRAEFGVTELPALDLKAAADAVRVLLTTLTEGELGAAWGPERMRSDGLKGADLMTMAPAPILETSANGLAQSMSVMPFPFRAYFYESPVRETLGSDGAVALIAELYVAALAAPNRVLSLTLETRNVYLPALGPEWLLGSDDTAAPQRPVVLPGQMMPALSRLVADVGRRLAAGLSLDEVRVVFGLREDAAALAEAEKKMEVLRAQEGRLMGLSIGLDLEAMQEN